MSRERGYYWVITDYDEMDDPVTIDGWEVAYYSPGEGWYTLWDGGAYADSSLHKINENKIEPNEK